MDVRIITNGEEKKEITRTVLEALTEWFEIEEAREAFIRESTDKDFFCAFENEKPVGFLYLKQTGSATVELAVMGVLKNCHRRGMGRALFEKAKTAAREKGYVFMQVKTVQMGKYEDFDKTNLFYRSLGFQEFEVFPTLWDEDNPCQIYIMAL